MRRAVLVSLVLLASSSLLAQQVDIPLSNWTVPPYRAASPGITPMVDLDGPRAFIPVQPCRIVDTRLANGLYGGPALAANVNRTFEIPAGPCLGIPTLGISAYSLSIGAILPPADGFLTAWPAGSTQPVVSQLNFLTNEVVANAAIVPNGDNNSITVRVNVGTHIYIDINGYFSSSWTGIINNFYLTHNSTAPVANFHYDSTGCPQGCALWATSHSTSIGAQAIYADLVTGGANSAAVEGHQGSFINLGSYNPSGVRGEGGPGLTNGVLGISPYQAVAGSLINSTTGAELTWGILGASMGVDSPGTAPWGVFSGGHIGAVGTKAFLDPHPTDPSRAIGYVSLEGPEAGTYFRGRARFQNGMARIPVPEHFRLVTDAEGLTVQITPIGVMASFAVLKMDLNEIVVQASRNVEFSYLVQGVRATYKDLDPFRGSAEFRPRSADANLPAWLSPAQQRLLIQNGTYREDGTVNTETARRLGWDRIWEGRPSPRPTPE